MTINNLKNTLIFASFGMGLASTVAIFQPNETLKDIGKALLGLSLGGLIVTELATSKAFAISEKEIAQYKKSVTDKDYEIGQLNRNIDKLQIELENQKNQKSELEKAISTLQQTLDFRTADLIKARESIAKLESDKEKLGVFSADEAYRIVRDTFNNSMRKLECHIDALARNYQAISDEFEPIYLDIDKTRNRWVDKLRNYEQITDFTDLLAVGLEYQQRIIDKCNELRVKGQQIAIRYLNSLLDETIPTEQYINDVENLQNLAGQTIQQLRDENESQVRAIVSDWAQANEQHIENYEINFTEVLETGKATVEQLKKRDFMIVQLEERINDLTEKVEELSKPWTFPGTIDYARAGNAIINFYYSAYGYTLDAINWQESETGYTLNFGTNRNKIYLTADMLEDKDNLPQIAGLTNSLDIPKIKPNYQSGLISIEITLRKPIKQKPIEKLETDISKIWVPAYKFESFVKNFERVRITAGSTGGKSPTAKNLALAILNNRKGKGTIKLYDPQHGSKKDFWNMPKAGISHVDNLAGLIELTKLLDSRRNGTGHEFTLYIFDEIDNTVSNLDSKQRPTFKDKMKIALKEGSHADIGAIFIGQSADANEVPGMTHSNWNNCVQIHIGANAGIAIDKIATITNEQKTTLLEQYRKIQDYCERKNDELGLDIFTDAGAYRFALVVPLSGLPKFIQLPEFDTYEYSYVMDSGCLDLATDAIKPEQTKIVCPHCGHDRHSKVGNRYRCNKRTCRKYFTLEDISNSN